MSITWIKIEDIQDGMLLSRTIEDEMGRILLRAGHELTRGYIVRLQKMGINQVQVDLNDDLTEPEQRKASGRHAVDSERWREIQARLERRFAPHQNNKIMRTIQKVASLKLCQWLGRE